MKAWVLLLAGLALVLLGGVWALQGFGVLKGSPMTGESLWLVVGLILVVLGLGLLLFALLRQRRAG